MLDRCCGGGTSLGSTSKALTRARRPLPKFRLAVNKTKALKLDVAGLSLLWMITYFINSSSNYARGLFSKAQAYRSEILSLVIQAQLSKKSSDRAQKWARFTSTLLSFALPEIRASVFFSFK